MSRFRWAIRRAIVLKLNEAPAIGAPVHSLAPPKLKPPVIIVGSITAEPRLSKDSPACYCRVAVQVWDQSSSLIDIDELADAVATRLDGAALDQSRALLGPPTIDDDLDDDEPAAPGGAIAVRIINLRLLAQPLAPGDQVGTLEPASTMHEQLAGAAALGWTGGLGPDAAAHGHAAGEPGLGWTGGLGPDGAAHGHVAGDAGAGWTGGLAPSSSAHGQAAGAAGVTPAGATATSLTVDGATFGFEDAGANPVALETGSYVMGEPWWELVADVRLRDAPASRLVDGVFDDDPPVAYTGRRVDGLGENAGDAAYAGTNLAEGARQGFESNSGTDFMSAPYAAAIDVSVGSTGAPRLMTAKTYTKAIHRPSPPPTGRGAVERYVHGTAVPAGQRPVGPGWFRPGVADPDKVARFHVDQLEPFLAGLPRLGLAAGAPTAAAAAAAVARSYPCFLTNGTGNRKSNTAPEYGRDRCNAWGLGAALLVSDIPDADKRPILWGFVQQGLDVLAARAAGKRWRGRGAGSQGWKLPAMIAAMGFGDAALLALAAEPGMFAEDEQTFIIQASDVGRAVTQADGRLRESYLAGDVGLPEWGEQHVVQPIRDDRRINAFYRGIHFHSMLLLMYGAVNIPGMEAAWDWPPLFGYARRHLALLQGGAVMDATPTAYTMATLNLHGL